MILLRPDCLGFEVADQPALVAPAQWVAFALAGPAMGQRYAQEIQMATAAVVYYFQHDLGRTTVSVVEFATALDKALRGLGLGLERKLPQAQLAMVTDLSTVLSQSGPGGELAFFVRLRQHLQDELRAGPATIRFCGLRSCVKRLLGRRRWTAQCQSYADEIVAFLRACLQADCRASPCALEVR
jgi:hypothetical protein